MPVSRMGLEDNGRSRLASHENHISRRLELLYTRQTENKQIFMRELGQIRKKREKDMLRIIKDAVGPRWYQALSVLQREALDKLQFAIYQDLLEGRPRRTACIMRALGLYPRPSYGDLMSCIYLGRDDPKEMLARLYHITYSFPIEVKRLSYSLNAKLILSAIFYLGHEGLITLLEERFRPDVSVGEAPQKPKLKPEPPLASPYLQKMVAAIWEKPVIKRPPPPPLPNLEDLDDPYEEEPIMPRPSPPPPPPPPPKKRIPLAACKAMAGIYTIEPHQSMDSNLLVRKTIKTTHRKSRSSKVSLSEGKKVYGIGINFRKKKVRRRKPVAPSTGLENTQYTINGVFEINGKAMYVLGNVSILPANGDLIHGGLTYVNNKCFTVHCGYRGRPPPPKSAPCDCQKKWHDAVFQYVKENKCFCGHHYDFGNEGTFPPEELPFFVKPTRHSPMHLNYHTIYDLDEKQLNIEKEFKRLWETDSVIHVDDGTGGALAQKNDKKKKKKKSSQTCLGTNPKPEDYLKCALRFMRRINIAARLPDLHLVPELIEWMRERIFGPKNNQHKTDLLRKSTTYWQSLQTLASKGYGHVAPPKEPAFSNRAGANWSQKNEMTKKFKGYIDNYKISVFRSHVNFSNLLWRTMFQAEQPDKRFREIFYSYVFTRIEDMQLLCPYSSREAAERRRIMLMRRYICLPAGIDVE